MRITVFGASGSIGRHVVEWTIVRPGAFVDGPVGGAYRHGLDGQDRTTQLKIDRADVAAFLLAQVTEDAYVRRAVSLSC